MQPTSPLRDSIRPEAELLLGWMRRLDGVMGNLLPTGGTVTVDGHAQPSVTESYVLARRTFIGPPEFGGQTHWGCRCHYDIVSKVQQLNGELREAFEVYQVARIAQQAFNLVQKDLK